MQIQNTAVKLLKSGVIAASLALATVGSGASFAAAKFAVDTYVANDFLTLYPGIYSEREKALVDKFLAANKAIQDRGEIDVKALVNGTLPKGTAGVSAVIKLTPEWVKYHNEKYDPENPLLNNSKYAQELGYKDLLAYPTIAAHDDSFMGPYPTPARDTLLVSDLNHNVTNYKPAYPGDTLYLVINKREMTDLTPTSGSTYRSVAIQNEGSIYNQHGEKIQDVIFRVTESIRILKDPNKAPKNPSFQDMWEAPNWQQRKEHKYTDADWAKIKKLWANEKRQGATPLFWEDVKVGDQPTVTADGPVLVSVSPIAPWGMGAGGSRTMKKEIMDATTLKTLVRNESDGLYRSRNKADYVPATPKMENAGPPMMDTDVGVIDTKDIHKEYADTRSILINYMGRDYAIRHLNNWMGDKGWLQNIRWSIMDPRAHARYGKQVPLNPQAEHFLDKVPGLKGKFVNTHGMSKDLAIVKSQVTNKYVRDGGFFVELIWWVETLEGDIFEEGAATVKLPSRKTQ